MKESERWEDLSEGGLGLPEAREYSGDRASHEPHRRVRRDPRHVFQQHLWKFGGLGFEFQLKGAGLRFGGLGLEFQEICWVLSDLGNFLIQVFRVQIYRLLLQTSVCGLAEEKLPISYPCETKQPGHESSIIILSMPSAETRAMNDPNICSIAARDNTKRDADKLPLIVQYSQTLIISYQSLPTLQFS